MPRSTNKSNLITAINPKSPISEAYRTLLTNVQFSNIDSQIQVLMVASAQVEEGKSTTASNLAVAYAQRGQRVLLIDGDLRKPTIAQIFNVSNRTGLSLVVSDQTNWQEAVQETSVEHLFILPSGPIPPNPSELLSSQKMKQLMGELKEQFDVIIIDTPPVLAVSDSLILSSLSDGVLMVVLAGKTKRNQILKAKASLEYVNANLIGVVLNSMKLRKGENLTYYYYGA